MNAGTNLLSVVFTPADVSDYIVASNTVSLVVLPAPLTVTAADVSRTYGQANPLFNGTIAGLTNGDAIAVAYACSATSASPVGTYPIVPGAAVGSDLTNYAITYLNGLLTISPASLTITANNRTKTYGQTVSFAGTEFSASGLLNGDTVASVTLTSAGSAASATVSGSPYTIVPSAAAGTGLGNYNITYFDGFLTVSQGASVVSWTNPPSVTYGAALGPGQLNASANVPGSFVYTPASGTVLNTGSNTLSVLFTPADPTDYLSASATVGVVVAPASLTVTAANTSRSFDTANPVFTGTINGLTNNDLISATYSCSATLSSPVGSYPIVPSLVDPNDRQTNYTVTLVDGALVIGRQTETVNWPPPAPIVYGTPLSGAQLNASVNVSGTYAYLPTNGRVLNTGTNTLTVVFAPSDLADYNSVTNTVSLVVTPAPLTITATNAGRTYGQANPIFGGTIAGLTNGDTITVAYTCGASSASSVGTYPIVPGAAMGNDLTNYTVAYVNGGSDDQPGRADHHS